MKIDDNKFWFVLFENPFHTFKKAKGMFKFPKIRVNLFWYKNNWMYLPYSVVSRGAWLFNLISLDVQWKDKYNDPRFESQPLFYFDFLHLFGFVISTYVPTITELGNKEDASDEYWEYLLNYVYYTKKLKDVNIWTRTSRLSDTVCFYPITSLALSEKGFIELNRELEENDKNDK